ncbi:vacuolar protein sorting-associated protein 41-like protein [Leptotrombidium deliense]|uniref:Vacuolar protein sorting-associated protein 41-like protein n=1 Tax=Leptotrombidium deliense TaxID=299467 RepID=A0A443SGE8_9ACAR|nr:vacuolar protein sorting-associated protein 41-like protein [Leptotrombidium deliense]
MSDRTDVEAAFETDENNFECSSDECEEEVEPKLTYERMVNDVVNILQHDSATCIAVHSKFIALGTNYGKIHILDHNGNRVDKALALHTTSVSQISIDEKGDFFASCSADKVSIWGLCSADHNVMFSFDDRPGRSIAIDPYFSRNSNRRFIVGDDRVILYEKGLLFGYKTNILHKGDGPIRNVRWLGRYVAWCSDASVRVFDMEDKVLITVIKRDHDIIPEIYRCTLCWKEEGLLLIGWGDSMKICVVKYRKMSTVSSSDVPKKYVEITSMFKTDFCVSGIATMGEHLVALSVSKDIPTDKVGSSSKPQLQVIESFAQYYNEVSSDILSPKGFANNCCCDYHLEWLPEDGLYYIVCPKDVIVAKPREEDDHISWLLERNRFPEALEAARNSKNLKSHSVYKVGLRYIEYLLEQNNSSCYKQAAQLCASIIDNDKSAWERQIKSFAQKQQLRLLAPFLPTGPETVLDSTLYEMVLNDFLNQDSEGFLNIIRNWPSSIYNIETLVKNIIVKLDQNPKNKPLLEALAEIYTFEGKHEKALAVYLEIGNRDRVFDLIRKFALYSTFQERLELFMNLNPDEASKLLLENQDSIPVDYVVSKLKHRQKLLWKYLDKVVQKDVDACITHHNLLVRLYAENAPERLIQFLKSSNHYSLEEALFLCRKLNLIPEVIFLLSRMGNSREALHYITNSMGDIDYAIEFCKENSDPDLWSDLIEHSMTKPTFVRVLLQNIGTHIPDPISLVKRIPDEMVIDGLMPALVKILNAYNLHISLEEGCNRVLVSDCYKLFDKLNKQQQRAVSVNESDTCQGCRRKVFANADDASFEHHIHKREDNETKIKKTIAKKPTFLEKSETKLKTTATPKVNNEETEKNITMVSLPANITTTENSSVTNADSNSTTLISELFPDGPELNISTSNYSLKEDTHLYYNSSFYTDPNEAMKLWVDLSKLPKNKYVTHEMLSNSYRRAVTVQLNFTFPFYGHPITNVTIATGGFLYLGDTVHSSLAATQYIAPLMANFDTSISKKSVVQYMENGTAFLVQWNNVLHQDQERNGTFSFEAILHANGDIVFVYKDVPFPVTEIPDTKHPVKVGISDAYVMESSLLKFIKRKTIYEYHRVDLSKKDISNNTAARFTLVTSRLLLSYFILTFVYIEACLSLKDCNSCVSEPTVFNCHWCESVKRCSNGIDRYRQQWLSHKCDAVNHDLQKCPANSTVSLNTTITSPDDLKHHARSGYSVGDDHHKEHFYKTEVHRDGRSGGEHAGLVSVFVLLALVMGVGVWVYYAYRNPQSSSGQFLIKYRPSQWRWGASEARYTAASIHM